MIKIDHLDVVRDHGFSLNNIDLIIPDGKMYGLVGPNGSGKSTLIETVCNKIHPDSGKISIDGKNISEYKIKELAKTISVMFQKSEISDFEIEDVVLAGRTPYKNIFEQFNSDFVVIWRGAAKDIPSSLFNTIFKSHYNGRTNKSSRYQTPARYIEHSKKV